LLLSLRAVHTHTHTDLLLPHYYYGKVVINPQKSLI